MRTILVLALAAWALGVPGVVQAADLTFGINGEGEYDSNVFRASSNEDDDFLFRIQPSARLSEDRGQDLSYSLSYTLPVEFAVQHSDLNDVDQVLGAEADYHINDRFSVFGSNDFRYLRNELRTNLEGTGSPSNSPFVNDQRDRITLNDAKVGASYEFTPRLAGSVRLDHDYYDPSRNDRATTNDLTGISSLQYALTPKHKVGGGFQTGFQWFDKTEDIVASRAQNYSIFGSWDWSIDEKTGFSIAAGPALIRNQQDDPPKTETRPLVPSQHVSSFTANNGLVNRNGAPIPKGTKFPNGALLVGDLNTCARTSNGIPVLSSGKSCPLNVVLDGTQGADSGLIDQIETFNATPITLSQQDPNVQGEDSDNVTVFATGTLRRDWTPTLRTALTYRRDQGTASGLGGTVVGDTVSLSNTYDLTEKWQFSARADWGQRKSVDQATRVLFVAQQVTSPLGGEAFLVPIAGVATGPGQPGTLITQQTDETNIDTMRWGLAGRVTHFLTRNTSGYLQFTYNQQTSKNNSLGDPSDFTDYLVTVGIQHVFEPIKLW